MPALQQFSFKSHQNILKKSISPDIIDIIGPIYIATVDFFHIYDMIMYRCQKSSWLILARDIVRHLIREKLETINNLYILVTYKRVENQ